MDQLMEAEELSQYLTFHLAGEEYAISILQVKEIIDFDTVTRVPKAPQFIRGVINLRGSVVPVLDLAIKLGLPETPITNRTCIIIVELAVVGGPSLIGVMTDDVSQVLGLLPGSIEPPPAFGMQIRIDCLLGIGKVDSRFVLILDIARALSTDELIGAEDVASCSA